ncbi:MAG: hypothetical protein JNN27_23710 [Planctomycetes bacterium]|nr:hypothetical protein [Planctomycetota bacterium]
MWLSLSSMTIRAYSPRALGRRGRQFVEEKYDWERVFDPLDALLARFERG